MGKIKNWSKEDDLTWTHDDGKGIVHMYSSDYEVVYREDMDSQPETISRGTSPRKMGVTKEGNRKDAVRWMRNHPNP